MYKYLLFLIAFGIGLTAHSQTQTVSGIVKDKSTSESIPGATILIKGTTLGTITNLQGEFTLNLNPGKYNLSVTFVGCQPVSQAIEVVDKPLKLTIFLESDVLLDEIEIIADVAKARETPVAFTTVLPAKINEELAGKELPMILNSTPGVYATQQGGGDGDARVTIRGFAQNRSTIWKMELFIGLTGLASMLFNDPCRCKEDWVFQN
jgi:iron complex outermembrane receptor protein